MSTTNKMDLSSDVSCNHKWIFQRSDYSYEYNTYGNSEYRRYDTYYCERCLDIKEILAKYESSRETPYWFNKGGVK